MGFGLSFAGLTGSEESFVSFGGIGVILNALGFTLTLAWLGQF